MAEAKWFSILTGTYVEPPKKQTGAKYGLGCNGCPLDDKRTPKLLSEAHGAAGMVWSAQPDEDSSDNKRAFSSRSARWFAKELRALGMKRSDFDFQYLVRCRPTDKEGDGRLASKQEQYHCGLHTRRSLEENGGAAVHLLLGKETHQQFLKTEYKKDRPVFWSEKHGARVFCLDQPEWLDRENTPEWRITEFRDKLRFAQWSMENPGRYTFLEHQDFKAVTTLKGMTLLLKRIRAAVARGERIAADIETGLVNGEHALLCIGFSWAKDKARTVFLDHPDNPAPVSVRKQLRALVAELLADKKISWVFHYGSSDVDELAGFGMRVAKFEFDTYYANYLKRTYMRSNGLENIANNLHPEYAGYKDIIRPFVSKGEAGSYSKIPFREMTLYNCADAALTKRIELETKDDVNLALLKTYTFAGFTLDRMEDRGPKFDQVYCDQVVGVIPKRVAKLLATLRTLAEDPNLNPNTPKDVAAVLYDKLGLQEGEDGRSTAEEAMNVLYQETQHPFIKALLEYRKYSKMESTYIRKYQHSANNHDGELRTKWYLAGTITGRLRSGGAAEGYDDKVNMQNLHGSAFLQNLLVSDLQWRRVLDWFATWNPTKLNLPDELLDLDVFLAGDYSQVEIRMLAEVSGDPILIKQFQDAAKADPSDPRSDIHCLVGHDINPAWSLQFIKQDKPTRTFVKNCHFGMVFGLDAQGLFYYLKAKGVDTTEEQAETFHTGYFKKYVGVAEFIVVMREFALEYGYVETIFGFRRMVGGDWDSDRTTNPANQAINSPIQGAAHTLLISAMAMLFRKPRTLNYLQTPLMEVHDALVFRTKLRYLGKAYAQAKHLLEHAVPDYIEKVWGRKLSVPLFSEFTAGFRYGVMVDYTGQQDTTFLQQWVEKNGQVSVKIKEEFGVAA